MAPSIWKLPKPSGLLTASALSSIGGGRGGVAGAGPVGGELGRSSSSAGDNEREAARSEGPAPGAGLRFDASSQGLLSSGRLSAHSGSAMRGRTRRVEDGGREESSS
jgi:hypothetical protein